NDGDAHVWNAETGRELWRVAGKRGDTKNESIWGGGFRPHGAEPAAARGTKRPRGGGRWGRRPGAPARGRPGPARGEGAGAPCVAVAFSPDGKRLAAGTQERVVHVWDVTTWQEVFQLGEHPLSVSGVAFSRDGGRLVSACGGHYWPARKKPKPNHWPLRGDDLK